MRSGGRSGLFAELLLQVVELGLHGRVHLRPVDLVLEQVAIDVGFGPAAAGRLEVAPRRLLRRRPARLRALPAVAVLLGQLRQIAVGERQLLPLRRQLLLEHPDPLPVPCRELLRDLHGFRIGHLRRQGTTALGIRKLLLLGGEQPLGRRQRIAHRSDRHLRFQKSGMELRSAQPGIARRRMVGKELLEPGPEPFKHGGIVRVAEWPNGTDRLGGRQGSGRVTLSGMRHAILLLPLIGLLGCSQGRSSSACGITAIAGATMLLQEFGVPEQTLGSPPANLPPRLVARVAAGPAFESVVGRTADSGWVIGVEGPMPERIKPRFGVLILDLQGAARGVMVFESEAIRGAPQIGRLSVDTLMLPLLGIQLDPSRFEDPACPLFPDSVLQ